MKKILFALITLMASMQLQAEANFDDFFKFTDQFLQKNVYRGMVNYQSIYEKPVSLEKLVVMIGDMPIGEKSNEEVTKAFYLNAYNILVIKGIIDNWPTQSPLEVDGFFDEIKYDVGGKSMTLSDLENKVIRKNFDDARIHFALVCAATDCPPLASNAYKPETVDGMLERQTITTINNNKFVNVTNDGTTVQLSKIFEWYKEDFVTEDEGNLIAYLNQFLHKPIDKDIEIEFLEYNWEINKGNAKGK